MTLHAVMFYFKLSNILTELYSFVPIQVMELLSKDKMLEIDVE